jgi:hypothetical protein
MLLVAGRDSETSVARRLPGPGPGEAETLTRRRRDWKRERKPRTVARKIRLGVISPHAAAIQQNARRSAFNATRF